MSCRGINRKPWLVTGLPRRISNFSITHNLQSITCHQPGGICTICVSYLCIFTLSLSLYNFHQNSAATALVFRLRSHKLSFGPVPDILISSFTNCRKIQQKCCIFHPVSTCWYQVVSAFRCSWCRWQVADSCSWLNAAKWLTGEPSSIGGGGTVLKIGQKSFHEWDGPWQMHLLLKGFIWVTPTFEV